jgi:hypothetical protein
MASRLFLLKNTLSFFLEDNMSDDRSKRGSVDRSRISLDEDYEVRDWTETLGVTRDELIAAVQAVGNSADKVKAYLRDRKHG